MDDQSSIPKGKLRRSGVVGIAAAKIGMKKAGQVSKSPFLSKKKRQQVKRQTDEDIAKIIFKALCILRGTALKVAQLIAMEIEFIPDAYRQELIKASSQVPPMNRALIRKIIKTQLGAPEKVFQEFSTTPFAAASLGQVHAATTREGQQLAVKVQYPDIAVCVKSDIDMLKGLLSPTKYNRIFHASFEEIRTKIDEELDYHKEASNTELFHAQLSPERFVVPTVAKDHSTASILSTSRIEGLHLEAWLATNPSQARRDHYGQLLVDLFNECTFRKRIIHADPNPGNYLFRDDGRLGIVDFGCVLKLSPEFSSTMRKLMSPERPADLETQEKLHNAIGVHYRSPANSKAFSRFLKEWFDWLKEPYLTERFDFSKSEAYFQRGTHFAKELYKYIDYYDGSFIYYGRCSHGLERILQQLGARVRMLPDQYGPAGPIESS